MWKHPEAHPGEYLRRRFLEPLGLSAAELAAGGRMPLSRVSAILGGKRAITADTALRLGAFFRMEPEAWMALQADFDLHRAAGDPTIEALDPPGVLVGPLGVTPLPVRRERTSTDGHVEVRYPDGTRALVSRRS
jgi:antitoxin HigA-1